MEVQTAKLPYICKQGFGYFAYDQKSLNKTDSLHLIKQLVI